MNNLSITGNLGNDCEVRSVGSGSVCQFSVAVKSGYGDREKTNWVSCSLWGKRAEGGLPEYLRKGTQVAVSGELSLDEWEKDGVKHAKLALNVNELDLIGGKSQAAAAPVAETDDIDIDIPF